MLKIKPYGLSLLILLMSLAIYASPADKKTDTYTRDTVVVNHLILESREYLKRGELGKAMEVAQKSLQQSKKIAYRYGVAKSYLTQGIISYRKGEYTNSLDYLNTAMLINRYLGDSVLQSNILNNTGNAYAYMGNHVKALEYYFKGLAIEEKLNNQTTLQWYYSNIGNLYGDQKNYRKGLEYSYKAVAVEERINDKRALSVTLSNIGGIYMSLELNDSALYCYTRSLKLAEDMKDTFSVALSLTNSAIIHLRLKHYDTAYQFAQKAYKISNDKGMGDIIIYNLKTLGDIDLIKKNYAATEKYYLKAAELSKKMGAKLLIRDAYQSLATLYDETKDYKKAFDYYELYSAAKDSLLNEDNSKLITEMNTKYTTEKKEKEIELLRKNEDIQKLELSRRKNELDTQRTVSIGVSVGFFLLMIVAILIYGGYRLKQKANVQLQNAFNLIEQKNEVIEQSNVLITDSITYAKRIQDAILPSNEEIGRLFSKDFFILYQPTQIVSGDFYWCSSQENKTIFVVADCTGHGVPGAFMSMIGNTLLNEIVNEQKVTDTKKIAELLDEKIIHSLHQDAGSEKYDGMDISICCIDRTANEISFTGAHHTMYAYNGHLQKIKGNSYSIGGAQQQNSKKFTSQTIAYERGLRLYFMTDGYCDQSGGEANKRFSSRQFERLLENIHRQEMHEQKEKLEAAFENWKGSAKQRDDVLVVGLKC
jgi:serine phosphatase RsbU (regulator of sigma subunit)